MLVIKAHVCVRADQLFFERVRECLVGLLEGEGGWIVYSSLKGDRAIVDQKRGSLSAAMYRCLQ